MTLGGDKFESVLGVLVGMVSKRRPVDLAPVATNNGEEGGEPTRRHPAHAVSRLTKGYPIREGLATVAEPTCPERPPKSSRLGVASRIVHHDWRRLLTEGFR